MSQFRSRGEKVLALLPKCNVPSDVEDESENDDECDDDQIAEKVDTFFQYLKDDFEEVYHGITVDHGDILSPKITSGDRKSADPAAKRPLTFEDVDEFPMVIDTRGIMSEETNEIVADQRADSVTFIVEAMNNSPFQDLPGTSNESDLPQELRSSEPPKPGDTITPIASTSKDRDSRIPDTKTRSNKRRDNKGKGRWKKGIIPKKGSSADKQRKRMKKRTPKAVYKWHRGIPFRCEVSQPPNVQPECSDQIFEPLHYFFRMFTSDMVDDIVFQSNLFAEQEKMANRMTKYNALKLDKNDILDYLAVEILTGLVSFPSIKDPWSHDLRFEKVASVMPLIKFKQIRQILHFNDNSQLPSDDPYFKVRPLVEKARRNFHQIPEEHKFSVDEMMIPYKGTRAGSKRQYMKDKPIRWGLKLFVRSGVSGITYDFFLYAGESTFSAAHFTEFEKNFGVSSLAVIALMKSIEEPALKFVFFDNYYSNPRLMTYLREQYGILTLGTIRTNRFPGLDFEDDKSMAKRGRGSFDMLVDNKKKLAAVKWLDNKPVHVVSTFCGAGPVTEVERWSKVEKRRLPVKCPEIIQIYNEFMGGVDLSGQLVSFYRTKKKSRKWYMCIFTQILDMAINNAWLLYRRDFEHVQRRDFDNNEERELYGPEKYMPLKNFRVLLATQLLKFERPVLGRPPTAGGSMKITPPKRKKKGKRVECSKDKNGRNKKMKGSKDLKHSVPTNVPPSVRFDNVGHLPDAATKGRCRFCNEGQPSWHCTKCQVRLCLKPERNCFLKFHQKEQK